MKKVTALIWSFIWGLGLVWGVVLLFDGVSLVSADPNVLYVAPGGLCGGAVPCYSSIQHAVDAASDGDQIKIAVGHYSSVELCSGMSQIVYISKTITLGGGYTVTDWSHIESASTILDAQSQGRVAYVTGSVTVTLENLVLTGGNATAAGGSDVGGGIYVNGANLSVVQNIISNNVAGSGGAIHAVGASVTVQTSQVMSNAGGLGFSQCQVMLVGNHVYSNTHGGIVLGSGTIAILDANDICKNTSEIYGAGIFIDHSVVTITHNIISENVSQLDGGGLMIFQSVATVEENRVFSNTAQGMGGGLMSFESDTTLAANTIIANQALQDGGGVFLASSDATLINNVIAQNQGTLGSAVFVLNSSPVYLVHNTIAQNGGGGQGMYVFGSSANPSTAALDNTIIVSQSVGIVNFNGSVDVNGVLWYGNGANYTGAVTVSSEITGSPEFVLPTIGDYRLGKSSAAIDAGIDAGIKTDIEGKLRDAHPDLGDR